MNWKNPDTGSVPALDLVALDESALMAIGAAADSLFEGRVPSKSLRFIINRYLRHPWYDYRVYALRDGARLAGLAVLRQAAAEGAHVLRIVDLIGGEDVLPAFANSLRGLVVDDDAEYVDLYCHGIDPEAMKAAGFLNCGDVEDLVVPNHFEPFERKSQKIRYSYRRFDDDSRSVLRLFRGDADQDRPNQL